jgi:hypothetical protein
VLARAAHRDVSDGHDWMQFGSGGSSRVGQLARCRNVTPWGYSIGQ